MSWTALRLAGLTLAAAATLAACDRAADRTETAAAPAAQAPAAPAAPAVANALGQLGSDLLASDARKSAQFTAPDEIFAHAPTLMKAQLAAPLHLKGVAGMKPQPPGKPPGGNGVHFVISKLGPDGAAQVLFEARIAPNAPAVPFDVQLEQGTTLQLETKEMGDTDYDWSYWGRLQAVP
ncbi:hypothetical protein [Phenylobacterium sp.]|jgi:hypothetical protein|uniref:hypothetical protein n=1 Tax=Phenylobacterium sp. TaxID=1871053 RepID=UPI002F948004